MSTCPSFIVYSCIAAPSGKLCTYNGHVSWVFLQYCHIARVLLQLILPILYVHCTFLLFRFFVHFINILLTNEPTVKCHHFHHWLWCDPLCYDVIFLFSHWSVQNWNVDEANKQPVRHLQCICDSTMLRNSATDIFVNPIY